jgi:hypothetical protein
MLTGREDKFFVKLFFPAVQCFASFVGRSTSSQLRKEII